MINTTFVLGNQSVMPLQGTVLCKGIIIGSMFFATEILPYTETINPIIVTIPMYLFSLLFSNI